MKEIFQYRNVQHLEYIPNSKKVTMNIIDSNDDYISQVDGIEMDEICKDFRFIKSIVIKKESVNLHFINPINCNLESSRYDDKLIVNVEKDGANQTAFVEKLPSLAERIF